MTGLCWRKNQSRLRAFDITDPFHPTASAVMPEIPVIVGANRTEMTLQLVGDAAAFSLDEAGMMSRAKELFRDKAENIVSVYRQSAPTATPSELFFLMISDYRYCAPIMKIAECRAALGKAPVSYSNFHSMDEYGHVV